MANSVDSDQLASLEPTDLDLHCLQKQGISGFSRTRVKGKEPGNTTSYKVACAPSEVSDQPAHTCIIGVFVGFSLGIQGSKASPCEQRTISPRKHTLWVLISSASVSTHNLCFCGASQKQTNKQTKNQ